MIAVAVVIACTVSASAQGEAGCVTAKCHADIGSKAWVHGPVGAGICTICHSPADGKDHEFTLAAEKEELCFNCHEEKRDMMLEEHQHTPVAEGNCIGCHDPHQADYRFQLKGGASELCFQCHDQDHFNDNFVHGPVTAGDCNACHNPHASANPKQLIAPPEELCFNCHQEKRGIMDMRHVHAPVAEKCTNCHNAHAGAAEYLLAEDPPDLCFSCHPDISENVLASTPHPPAAEGECLTCHEVHGSEYPKLFTLDPTELCFSCHDEMEEYVLAQEFRHGPVKQGDCNACHNPHGSENHRILRKNFPEAFYTPYAEENYALCFDCHNRQIALDEKTTSLTDFRDNDRNLHYLHVNKQDKGRSCRACHQVHASSQEKHVRLSVPFGKINWELPVKFTKSSDGGSCVVGCHAPKEYSREK
jgi:predicted CXXCH cytochrome family protein